MQADWINPFIVSTVATFETMFNCSVRRGTPKLKESRQPGFEVSGLMSLEGKASGIVVVSLHRDVAVSAVTFVMGNIPETIDEDVIDIVCEITNMVAGGANNQLSALEMKIGLPSVVSGKNHTISYPTGVATISIPFDSDWGPLCVDASIKDSTRDQSVPTKKEVENFRSLSTGAHACEPW